ncbi:MAG: thiamine pyrophosphate-binding protein [Bryobacterales bacterium]|nr:thiamine pyrophosphate-binding protein [Bryobacterales bacterium]
MKRTAVEWFVEGLRERGCHWISALCGHGLDPLFFASRRAGIRIVDVRNEQTAGYIADYEGRLTRRPGVCASSSGVAVANALSGVMNAWFDHSPMLYISGTANSDTLGIGAFQDSPHVEMAKPTTKLSLSIDHPTRVLQILDLAWQTARSAPQGPVHLQFPMDIQSAEVDEADLIRPVAQSAAPITQPIAYLQQTARALLEAKRPLIIAGSEVYYANEGQSLVHLVEAFAIPVQTPIWDRGVFDHRSELFNGVIGAASGGPALLEQSDCVILAAVSDYRVGYLQHAKHVHRLTRGWSELATAMIDLGIQPYKSWAAEARRLRDAHTQLILNRAQAQRIPGRLHAVDVVQSIGRVLPAEATLLIDGGSIGQWAHQILADRRYPSYWLTCGRSGVVGYGLAGAMAAKLANPNRPAVLLSGDGAFTFTVAEIECAVRHRLPFVAIVADDRCWGITHSGHLKQFGEGVATELGSIDFATLAQSLGARGVQLTSADNLDATLAEAIAGHEVTIIHVPISGGNPH